MKPLLLQYLQIPFLFAVVDLYTCEIHFNTVRLIAVSIICLGFLMLLLPEDWDQCIIQLSTKLRKRDEPAEGSADAGATTGLNWRGRSRTSMSTFAHWLHETSPNKMKHTQTQGGRYMNTNDLPSVLHGSLAEKTLDSPLISNISTKRGEGAGDTDCVSCIWRPFHSAIRVSAWTQIVILLIPQNDQV